MFKKQREERRKFLAEIGKEYKLEILTTFDYGKTWTWSHWATYSYKPMAQMRGENLLGKYVKDFKIKTK